MPRHDKPRSAWRFVNPVWLIGSAVRRAFSSSFSYHGDIQRKASSVISMASEVERLDAPPAVSEADVGQLRELFRVSVSAAGLSPERLYGVHRNLTIASLGLYGLGMAFLLIAAYFLADADGAVFGIPVFGLAFLISAGVALLQGWSLAFRAWQIERCQLGGLGAFRRDWACWLPWFLNDAAKAQIAQWTFDLVNEEASHG